MDSIPILIGITGHRDIAPDARQPLRGRVLALLSEVRRRYPASPVTVLSPLAAGADALCAGAALEAGCALAAPLPLAPEDYRGDFSPEEAAVFDELCEHAQDVFVVPDMEDRPPAPGRAWHYRQAGLYVAAHSHLLLALWDGKEPSSEDGCGTGDTVRQMLGGVHEGLATTMPAGKCGPVLRLATAQGDAPAPDGPPGLTLYEPGCPPRPCEGLPPLPLLEDIDAFNREAAARADLIEAQRDSCVAGCVDPALLPGLGPDQRALLGAFAAADTLAVHNQKKRLRVLQGTSLVALLLVLSFLFYDDAGSYVALVAYGVLLLPAFAIFYVSARRRYHEQYLLLRTLAETLRVQFYLRLAGITRPWLAIPAWRRERGLSFMQNAAAGFCPLPSAQPGLGDAHTRLEEAQAAWVEGQLAYHRRSLEKKGRKNRFNENAGRGLLIAAVLFYLLVLVLEFAAPAFMARPFVDLPDFSFNVSGSMKITLGVLFAAAAFLSNYYGKLDLPRQMGSDEQMAALFALAAEALNRHENDPAARQELLLELARAHSEETISWFVYQSGNAPEIMIG